ncbi:hypothetical protein JCM8208_007801 [Rhodotorula glutinis]
MAWLCWPSSSQLGVPVIFIFIFIFVFIGTRARLVVFECLGMIRRHVRPPERVSFVVNGEDRVNSGLFCIAAPAWVARFSSFTSFDQTNEFIPDLADDLLHVFKRFLMHKGLDGYVLSERSPKMPKHVTQSDRLVHELVGVLLLALIRLVYVIPPQVGTANVSLILQYVLEAMRLKPSVTGIARRVKADADKKPNELISVDLVSCGRDDKAFVHPDNVDVTRNALLHKPLYCASSVVNHEGESYNFPLVSGIVRELLTVNSPSRSSGSEGQLGVVEGPLGLRMYARDDSRERPRAFPGRVIVVLEGVKAKR